MLKGWTRLLVVLPTIQTALLSVLLVVNQPHRELLAVLLVVNQPHRQLLSVLLVVNQSQRQLFSVHEYVTQNFALESRICCCSVLQLLSFPLIHCSRIRMNPEKTSFFLSFFPFFPRARTRSTIVTKTMSHKVKCFGCEMFQVCFVKFWFKRDPVSTTTMMATMGSTKEREGPSTNSTMVMVATAATTEREGLSTISTASVAVGAAITTNEREGHSTTSTVTLGASITTTETKGL